MIVNQFGLHWAPGDIGFLIQSSGTTNLISPNLASPFSLKVRKTDLCPHDIDLQAAVPLPDWIEDPLARAMSPAPRRPAEKALLISDRTGEIMKTIQQLCRLSSPTGSIICPIWFRMADGLKRQYALTNVSPIVLTSAEINHSNDIQRHIALAEAHNRRLLIVAAERLPPFHGVELIETGLSDLSREPLEGIGATILRKEMQGV